MIYYQNFSLKFLETFSPFLNAYAGIPVRILNLIGYIDTNLLVSSSKSCPVAAKSGGKNFVTKVTVTSSFNESLFICDFFFALVDNSKFLFRISFLRIPSFLIEEQFIIQY